MSKELEKIRNIAKDLAIETDELYNYIMKKFEIEIGKSNNRIKYIIEHLLSWTFTNTLKSLKNISKNNVYTRQ